MPRAPFQILVIPYRKTEHSWQFAVLSRADYPCWQGIAGGGEDDENPLDAAKREAFEEAGVLDGCSFVPLQAMSSKPVYLFSDSEEWDESLYVIPEHSFGVDCTSQNLVLSHEHNALEWLSYAEALARLTYDSNRTALWELHQRLQGYSPHSELN